MKYIHYCESISDFEDKSENCAVSDPWVSVTEGFGVTYSPALDTNGYECVDLGLPSGILWASCNVGASNPEDYGYYFAWGETSTKETYDWTTYAWGSSANSFTRYGGNTGVSLYSSDDAAIARMGSFWRMPTSSEAQEILNNTAVTIETLNGIIGARFTGQNGNSIFFPAAGAKYQEEYYHEPGSFGLFWTSTRVNNNTALAHTLYANITSETNGLGAGSRMWGVPIRGVFVGHRDWYNEPRRPD